MTASIRAEPFGVTATGRRVERWWVDSGTLRLGVLTLGATVQSLHAPDRAGRPGEVVLGLPDVAAYEADRGFTGATVGRYANRIGRGRFILDGVVHEVPATDRGHALHGGPDGFHRRLWQAGEVPDGVRLVLESPDGDMGFPGRLRATATFTVVDAEVTVDLAAVTDAPTVVSLAQHSYFNLGGPGVTTIDGHRLLVDADHHLPVDDTLLPTGSSEPVAGTRFDLREPKDLAGASYDDCWVLSPGTAVAARLEEPEAGRTLEVLTDRPGLQVFTGDGLPVPRGGVALETQAWPDTPNHPEWPGYDDVVLRPGEEWSARTVWRFTAAQG